MTLWTISGKFLANSAGIGEISTDREGEIRTRKPLRENGFHHSVSSSFPPRIELPSTRSTVRNRSPAPVNFLNRFKHLVTHDTRCLRILPNPHGRRNVDLPALAGGAKCALAQVSIVSAAAQRFRSPQRHCCARRARSESGSSGDGQT